MAPENDNSGKNNDPFQPSEYLAEMDNVIRVITLRGMTAGNDGDFETAFLHMELALWLARSLENKCLEATLLNNLGLLYTMQGTWDRALFTFDRAMEIALAFCESHDKFIAILKKNISCLFDPKLTIPGDPDKD
ncbi:MAG: tetratricopeptide repeat protein [Desulfobacterales bacterium]|nr:tetratricopeptide repeat protein [Desulfobacterales bacterium]